MKKELETIIENKFDCLINDLGCLIGEEWKAEAVKKAVNQAFVLGGVINWVACKDELPNENQKVLTYNQYGVISNSWCKYTDQDDKWFKNRFTHWAEIPNLPCLER